MPLEMKADAVGGYTVFNARTGVPAVIDGREQIGLDIEDADDLVDLLNKLERERAAGTPQ